MQMNQQEQKWLVLLYSLIELDGGSQRKNVLRHIQENRYWGKNDLNDVSRTSRNEKVWRNDFSFERQHLVDRGYMQDGVKGIWEITEAGKEYLDSLAERLIDMPYEDTARFTVNFYHKFFQTQMHPEFTADRILLEQLSQAEEDQEESPIVLSDKPAPKGPVRL